jgi:hypothetical protein
MPLQKRYITFIDSSSALIATPSFAQSKKISRFIIFASIEVKSVLSQKNDEFRLLPEDYCRLLRDFPYHYGRIGISTNDNNATTIGQHIPIPV